MTEEIKKEDEVKIDEEIKVEEKTKHGLFRHKCKKCEELEKQCEEYKSGWQRALADYKNLQRETEQRRGEWAQMSEVQIIEEFLPVYENLKQAFKMEHGAWNMEQANWAKGMECIKKQFAEVLKQHGIEEIKTVGEKFDPNLHEASGEAHEPEPGGSVQGKKFESGTIVREVSGGYRMGGKVIRAARVIVVK